MERSSREILLFGIGGFGILMAVVGIIITSVPLSIVGVILIAMSLAGFAIKNWLGGA